MARLAALGRGGAMTDRDKLRERMKLWGLERAHVGLTEPLHPAEALGRKILDCLDGAAHEDMIPALSYALCEAILNLTSPPEAAARAITNGIVATVDEMADEYPP
jgi:hypothetical protein